MEQMKTVKYAYQLGFFEIVKETPKFYIIKSYEKKEYTYYEHTVLLNCDGTKYYQFIDKLGDEHKIAKKTYEQLEIENRYICDGQFFDGTTKKNIIPLDDDDFYRNKNFQTYCLDFEAICIMLKEKHYWQNVHILKYPSSIKTMNYNFEKWDEQIKKLIERLNKIYEKHDIHYTDPAIHKWIIMNFVGEELNDQTEYKFNFIIETQKLLNPKKEPKKEPKEIKDLIVIDITETQKLLKPKKEIKIEEPKEIKQDEPKEKDDDDKEIEELEKKLKELQEKKKQKEEKKRKIEELKRQIKELENE